jgi:hypothetical protein
MEAIVAGDLPPLADLKNRWENVNGHLLVLMQQDVSPSWWAQRHTSLFLSSIMAQAGST